MPRRSAVSIISPVNQRARRGMQNTIIKAVAKAVSQKVWHDQLSLGLSDRVEGRYSDLSHFDEVELTALAASITGSLEECGVLRDPQDLPCGDDQLDGEDEAEGFYRTLVAIVLDLGVGRFEIENERTLGVPYPVYEVLAKNVFEALEDCDLLASDRRIDGASLIRNLFAAGKPAAALEQCSSRTTAVVEGGARFPEES